MVDEEIVVTRLELVQQYTDELREMRDCSREEFVADTVRKRAVERSIMMPSRPVSILRVIFGPDKILQTQKRLVKTSRRYGQPEPRTHETVVCADTVCTSSCPYLQEITEQQLLPIATLAQTAGRVGSKGADRSPGVATQALDRATVGSEGSAQRARDRRKEVSERSNGDREGAVRAEGGRPVGGFRERPNRCSRAVCD